jgi:ABC-type multidrug transport system fused ATPase/permease subunit
MKSVPMGALWALVRRYFLTRKLLVLSLILILVVSSADLFCPWLAMHALNAIIDGITGHRSTGNSSFQFVLRCAGGILLLAMAQYISRYRMSRLQNWTIYHGSARLRSELYGYLQSERSVTAADRRIGDSLSRLVSDVQAMQDAVLEIIAEVPYDFTRIFGVVCMMLILNWELGLIVIAFLAIAGLASFLIARRGWRSESRNLDQLGNLSARFQEALSAGRMLHSLNATETEAAGLSDASTSYATVQEDGSSVQAAVAPFFALTEYAGLILVLVVGGWYTLHGQLTPGGMVAFLAYMEVLADPLTRLGNVLPTLQRSHAAATRIGTVLDLHGGGAVAGGSQPEVISGAIAVHSLGFTYPQSTREALSGLTMSIPAGQRVVVIGRNGAGKSTFFDLLLGMHQPTAGSISVDGNDLRGLDQRYWRSKIGVMPQDVVLMNRSISENISLGAPSDQGVRTAVRMAGFEDVILALPQGFDTVIGERGALLSGGQRQRLAIARLLVRNPSILLLDEPTSALDADAESELLPIIDQLCAKRTTFIISHRAALLARADRVLILDAGRMVGFVTPSQAWREHADYRDLFPPAWATQE